MTTHDDEVDHPYRRATDDIHQQFDVEDGKVVRHAVEQVERSARRARWLGNSIVFVGVLVMLGSAFINVYVGVQIRGLVQRAVTEQQEEEVDAAKEAEAIGTIMTCILGQFAEHRAASKDFFDQSSRVHGFVHGLPQPPYEESAPYNPETTRVACEKSLHVLNGDPPPSVRPER